MISRLYSRFCQTLPTPTSSSALLVAYSGGLDSTLLLLLAERYAREHRLPLGALHVHHGLSPHADEWAERCAAFCRQLGVALQVERVQLARGNGESLEAQARSARYARLGAALPPGGWLLTAHHQDDQLETLLLALKRGAGPRGLAGILPSQPFADGLLLRPLLAEPRQVLAEAVGEAGVSWVEDESNQDVSYDRNFLRQQVIPVLKARWPAIAETAARSMALCAEQETLLAELAEGDWQRAGDGEALRIAPLHELSPARRNNLLRHWIRRQGGEMPARDQLARLWDELVLARPDANPQLNWGRVSCRRHQGRLYLVRPDLAPLSDQIPLTLGVRATLPEELGTLGVIQSEEGPLRLPRADEPLSLRFAVAPGQTLRPLGRGGSRRLKKLWQEYGIPSWQRGRVPILFYGEQPAAVPGLFICEGFARTGPQGLAWLRQGPPVNPQEGDDPLP
ncbi:tRNA lysidine(34) synthetase TilS [Aeromonas bivalvium]|uniref:tRNA lysidine(34) synthetase TilS n=1 Tax=Aeromonas bivalvium TaxID=440079 RepID=UPI000DCFF1BC|nr:tRNA lysidine(34) synthetase TilS [Aeromonas bivalvium]